MLCRCSSRQVEPRQGYCGRSGLWGSLLVILVLVLMVLAGQVRGD